MLRIRFFRTGKKNQPFFRIVVTDKRNPPRGGRFLEILGFYNPLTKEKGLKKERIKYWLSVGAKPSNRVHNLLIEEKILEGEKIAVHKKKKEKKKVEEEKPSPEQTVEKKPVLEQPPEQPKEEVKEKVKPVEPEDKSQKGEEK